MAISLSIALNVISQDHKTGWVDRISGR